MGRFNESDSYRLMRDSASSCRFALIARTHLELAIIKLSRLNAQHYLWKQSCGFNLHPQLPIPLDRELRIADIGTGTPQSRSSRTHV